MANWIASCRPVVVTRTVGDVVPVVVAILAPLLLFWRLVFGGEVLYWGVPLMQFYPWHTLINSALAAGQWPLWTDLLGNGAPLLANHQSALFYPPNLIFRLLPVEHALGYSVVLHIVGAGLAALFWGRTLDLGWIGRTVLALSYALGGYVMGRTQFITMVAAYAWLPLLLALTEQLVRRRRTLDAVWLGGALAMQFLAGHAQTWFYSLLLVAAFACYRLISHENTLLRLVGDSDVARGPFGSAIRHSGERLSHGRIANPAGADIGAADAADRRRIACPPVGRANPAGAKGRISGRLRCSLQRRREQRDPDPASADCDLANNANVLGVGRGLALLTLAVILSVCLSAVQLLPTAELALNSQRGEGAEQIFAMTYSYWPWRLLTLLAPDLYGNPALGNYVGYATYWEDHAYVGLLPLIFVLMAVASHVSAAIQRARACAASRYPRLPARAPAHSPPDFESGASRVPVSRTDVASGMCALEDDVGDGDLGQAEPSRSVVPFFALLLPIAIVLAMGDHTPVFPFVFEHVPGFGLFQAPARMMIWFAVGASTLAGIGADGFRLTYRRQYVLRLAAAGSAAMVVVALAMERAGVVADKIYGAALVRLAVLLGLACLLLLLRGREPGDPDVRVMTSRLPRTVWRGLVVALVGADLIIAAMTLTPTLPDDVYRAEDAGHRVTIAETSASRLHVDLEYLYGLSYHHFFRFNTFGPTSVAFWSDLRGSLLPNLNAVDGIPSTGNNEPLVVDRWRDLVEQTRHASPVPLQRLLQLMNVGLVLTDRPAAGWEPVAGVHNLYRPPSPLPRAWIVYDAEMVANADQALSRLTADGFDPRQTVLIEAFGQPHPLAPSSRQPRGTSPPSGEGGSPAALAAEAGVDEPVSLQEDWNRRTIRLTASRTGYLVMAYTYYPGWFATVDGRAAPLLRADHAFMAVPVEGGPHEIIVFYRPSVFRWGAIITGLAAVVTVVACAWVRWRS